MEDYKLFFKLYLEEIKCILENVEENNGLKFEEYKFIKSELEIRREMAKDLDKFLLNMVCFVIN